MPISFRTYVYVGLAVGFITFLFGLLFGDDIAQWALDRQVEAASKDQRVLEELVFRPLELLMARDSRLAGLAVAVIFWPALLVLLFLVVISLIILSFVDVNEQFQAVQSVLPLLLGWA